MSSYQDVYGVLGLAAMPGQESLNLEFIRQFRKNKKMASYTGCSANNTFLIDSELMRDEDAYESIYEHVWAGLLSEA